MEQTIEVQSLDTLTEQLQVIDEILESDEESALADLISAFGPPSGEFEQDEEFVREDEFICNECHLVLHRSRAAHWPRRRCQSCTVGAPRAA